VFSNKHNGFRGHGKEKPSNVEIFCLFNCFQKKKKGLSCKGETSMTYGQQLNKVLNVEAEKDKWQYQVSNFLASSSAQICNNLQQTNLQ
jgi:hypothetical protein